MSNSRNRWRVVLALGAVAALIGAGACVPDAPDGNLPTGPSDKFSVTLAWDAPTTDAAGNPLGDLSGYRLYYAIAGSTAAADSNMVEVGDTTQVTVNNLPAGDYVFAVTALDMMNNESGFSDPLEVAVGP